MNNFLYFRLILSLVIFSFFICGCKKKEDDPHPADISSSTHTSPTWTYSSPNYVTTLTAPEITSSNINSVAVMVYVSINGSSWTALPFTQYHSPYNYYMGFQLQTGSVIVYWFYDSSLSMGDDPNTFYGTPVQFKLVVISKAARVANPDLDWNDYETVKEEFDLEE